MKKKIVSYSSSRAIILYLLSFLLCTGLVIGGTYALLSKVTKNEGNIITTGNVNLDVVMTYQSDTYVNGSGEVTTSTNDTERNLATTPDLTIISLDNPAPGDYGSRKIRVDNTGNYFFSLGIAFEVSEDSDAVLLQYINISVTSLDGETVYASGTLSDIKQSDNNQNPYAISRLVACNENVGFIINYEFSEDASNDCQNKSLEFAVVFYATQTTA